MTRPHKPEARRLAALLLALLPGSVFGMEPDVVGTATDLSTGEYLYSEQHFCVDSPPGCNVRYMDADGVVFASKEIDYSINRLAPNLTIQDYRQGQPVRLNFTADAELVVDAGFDNFVRSRWEDLERGRTVAFPFVVVGRQDPLNMRAVNSVGSECADAQLCLRVELESWLLRMLVSPIQLTYDRDSRRLLRFRGISNIRSDSGKSQQVDIRYSYAAIGDSS